VHRVRGHEGETRGREVNLATFRSPFPRIEIRRSLSPSLSLSLSLSLPPPLSLPLVRGSPSRETRRERSRRDVWRALYGRKPIIRARDPEGTDNSGRRIILCTARRTQYVTLERAYNGDITVPRPPRHLYVRGERLACYSVMVHRTMIRSSCSSRPPSPSLSLPPPAPPPPPPPPPAPPHHSHRPRCLSPPPAPRVIASLLIKGHEQ